MSVTNRECGTGIDEVAEDIFRITTPIPPAVVPGGFSLNQDLVLDDEPLLFHTGTRRTFDLVPRRSRRFFPWTGCVGSGSRTSNRTNAARSINSWRWHPMPCPSAAASPRWSRWRTWPTGCRVPWVTAIPWSLAGGRTHGSMRHACPTAGSAASSWNVRVGRFCAATCSCNPAIARRL